VDLFQLETFLTVSEEGSFSRAAKKLYRTQPAVSQTVRKLEDEIGEPLFDRSSRDGILTDAGRVLQEYARRMLNMRGEAVSAIEELKHLDRGRVLIAANEVTCLYLLPVLHEYRRRHPMVRITIRRSLASKIQDELTNHNVELGLLTFRPEDTDVKSIVVYRDELVFVVPTTHPLAALKEVSIKQLGTEVFIAHNVPSPYREKVLDTFRKKRVPLHMDVELPTIEAIKKFVAMENGVALLPGICVENEVRHGELVAVPVPELSFERKLRIVYRREQALSHAARAFLQVAEAFAGKTGGRYVYQVER
jgi:DNA-binding transcriptional LysR family regulator